MKFQQALIDFSAWLDKEAKKHPELSDLSPDEVVAFIVGSFCESAGIKIERMSIQIVASPQGPAPHRTHQQVGEPLFGDATPDKIVELFLEEQPGCALAAPALDREIKELTGEQYTDIKRKWLKREKDKEKNE